MVAKDVYVLYGSQTGNAESIAKDLFTKLQDLQIASTVQTLNSVKKTNLKESARFVVIICSTTGNGDAPENADAWWRATKLRSAAKDLYEGVPFAVLGLGDTNYDKFCYMGKSIDKRLSELGGSRAIELYCADEATNLEEVVEEWKSKIVPLLVSLKELPTTGKSSNSAVSLEPKSSNNGIEGEIMNGEEDHAGFPNEICSFQTLVDWLNLTDAIVNSPGAALLPTLHSRNLKEPTYKVLNESRSTIKEKSQKIEIAGSGWSVEAPYLARVMDARWLTAPPVETNLPTPIRWGEDKRVVHLQLQLGQSGIIYQPGDSIGICCPNSAAVVECVLTRLNLTHDTIISVPSTDDAETETIHLGEFLQYRVDLSSVPRKAVVLELAAYCTSDVEKVGMQWLCSKGDVGKALWSQFIESQRIGLGELLSLFRSCCPPLAQFFSLCSPMPPRYYSIASSPLESPNTLAVAFSLVRYRCGCDSSSLAALRQKLAKVNENSANPANDALFPGTIPAIRRSGLCTSFLEKELKNFLTLSRGTLPLDITLRIFHKPTLTFRLPGSVAIPLILVGPGTGVAPFVGFLDHRAHLENLRLKSLAEDASCGVWRGNIDIDDLPGEGTDVSLYVQSISPGPLLLFFGCRNDDDYLYKEKIQGHLQRGILSSLEVAMSRPKSNSKSEKQYVTHKILVRGAELAKLILSGGASVYVCGDGNNMAKDVASAIASVLREHGDMNDAQAADYITDMKLRKRYVQDIWS